MALFWAYLARCRESEQAAAGEAAERARASLNEATAALAETAVGPGLYGGFAGTGWVLEHVGRTARIPIMEIDDVLLAFLERYAWRADYDLISGWSASASTPSSACRYLRAERSLQRVVEHLAALAVELPQGATWFTPPALVPPNQRPGYPVGYYNLGVAHGVPGVIVLLALACRGGSGGRHRTAPARRGGALAVGRRGTDGGGRPMPLSQPHRARIR